MNRERLGSCTSQSFERAIYVLHCFQKKSQKTSKADIDIGRLRYKDLLKELNR